MNFGCTQHSSSKLGSAFVCTKFLIFSISYLLNFSSTWLKRWSVKMAMASMM